MKTPMISVVMPVYNGEKYLGEAIDSILKQTYTDFEFIILNDGSTDRTEEIVLSYDDPRIVYVKNDKNLQIVKTLNKGIALAKGKYIARMDADDISLPERFEKQVEVLELSDAINVVFSFVQPIDDNGDFLEKWEDDMTCVDPSLFSKYLPKVNCFAHPTLMISSTLLKQYLYDIHSKDAEDYNLWLRLFSEKIGILKIPEVLLYYRMHSASVSFQSKEAISFYKKNMKAKYRFMVFHVLKKGKFTLFGSNVLGGLIGDSVRLACIRLGFTSKNIKRALVGFGYGIGLVFSWKKDKDFVYFFIPWYHVGGGERVHLDIVSAANDIPSKVIFTDRSRNNFFLNDFKKVSKVYDYPHIMGNKFLKFIVMGMWAAKINRQQRAIVFNCSSDLVYDMLPFLRQNITVIDLLHAFTGKGIEQYSLPFLSYIDQRIVIHHKIAEELNQFYKKNNILQNVVPKTIVMENGVKIPKNIDLKHDNGSLKILYVGRGSEEKRVHLVGRIATLCKNRGINSQFILLGNVEKSLLPEDKKNCYIEGEVKNVSDYYKKADMLLITSTTEGFPMVVMESMAYGVIPICTDVGGISIHISDGKNGFLVKNTDENGIVHRMVDIINMLALDYEKRSSISTQAAVYAREHFDKMIFMKNYSDFFHRFYYSK